MERIKQAEMERENGSGKIREVERQAEIVEEGKERESM
ncbi:uncharacterized, partial [Tachysurus ichikawai]